LDLHARYEGVELAEQGLAVFLGCLVKVIDESLHGITAGSAERIGATKIGGIAFHEIGI
jgi:hypothetical protein